MRIHESGSRDINGLPRWHVSNGVKNSFLLAYAVKPSQIILGSWLFNKQTELMKLKVFFTCFTYFLYKLHLQRFLILQKKYSDLFTSYLLQKWSPSLSITKYFELKKASLGEQWSHWHRVSSTCCQMFLLYHIFMTKTKQR